MRVLVTGADGFVGKNLSVRLRELQDVEVLSFTRQSSAADLSSLVARADFIFHLAGVNRPKDVAEFAQGNVDLTAALADCIRRGGRAVPVVYSSSIQAERDNPYGRSKKGAEDVLLKLNAETNNPVQVFRLPNVFGKWCKPNYNSVVATFCHNVVHDLPLRIDDPASPVSLVYVDDVVAAFTASLQSGIQAQFGTVEPVYQTTVGALAAQLQGFKSSRTALHVDRVGTGLTRALYATYVSYLPPEQFSYEVPSYGDARGVFVEMLKTPDAGQFSFFTAHPGVTRGGHYHHTKTEKFLVLKGTARFRFRHLTTGQFHEFVTSGDRPRIVDTIPGWSHDISNVGSEEMIVMLWANEVFDRARPDTVARAL